MNKIREFVKRCYWNMAKRNFENNLESQELFDKRFELIKYWIGIK